MSYQGIENYLKNISNAYAHFTLFETTPEYSLIGSSIESILRNSSALEGFNETLKLIISTMIDTIWFSLNRLDFPKAPLVDFVKDFKSESRLETKAESQVGLRDDSKSKIEDRKLFRSESSYGSIKYRDVASPSKRGKYNCYFGNVGFKDRDSKFVNKRSYEKSDPYHNIDYVLPASPKITFPKEPRKFSFQKN